MTFYEKLENIWKASNSFVCVGLDPDLNKLPEMVKKETKPIFEFNKKIIDATHDLICAYKPQIAYYSAFSAEDELKLTIDYCISTYPNIPIILDAKRNDIGSTAEMYAIEAFDRYRVDAVTVNPYMGSDTIEPFSRRKDKGIIVLCKTSNPSSNEMQSLKSDEELIYEIVARKAQSDWNKNKNILLVVGATYPEEMKNIRNIAPDIPFLVPGVGAQGGNPKEVINNGVRNDGFGLIINSSRGIIYSSPNEDFDKAAREATKNLRDMINEHR